MNTAARLARLRALLRERELEAIVITHPSNRFWLSGFTGEDIPPNESAGHLVIGQHEAFVVTSRLNSTLAQQEALGFHVFDRERDFARGDAIVLQELGVRRVGFEDRAILYRDVHVLRETLGEGIELVPVGTLVDELRAVKSPDELEIIARAQAITDTAFQAVVAELRPGLTERDVALRLERALVEAGADGPAFPIAVASGPHGALPHYRPTRRVLASGEPIVIDMGAVVDGYCADLTRTVWLGRADERLEAIFAVVLEAVEAAEAGIRPGMTGREADALARAVIARAGYADAFTHSLGHGVGVRVHEAPSLSPASEHVLEPGHVVTIEPGIYLPGWGGVRIEDLVVIRQNGVEVLTRTPKRLAVPTG
ncbi:MAG: aminopeptidase P family protein [Thermomicrobium sp.]|nr:aminopeptidase P family protein [Thermomicrobium sp.]